MNNIKNKSPLRYPGGKTRACKKLDIILKENFDISRFNNIVSPFIGGGSFEFYIQNNYGLNISSSKLNISFCISAALYFSLTVFFIFLSVIC